jgi:hypothetical protein
MPALFKETRACCICRGEAASGAKKPRPWEPVIVALNVTIYRKISGRRQLATATAVRVCESCLIKVLASRGQKFTLEAFLLAQALYGRISDRYSLMADRLPSDTKPANRYSAKSERDVANGR